MEMGRVSRLTFRDCPTPFPVLNYSYLIPPSTVLCMRDRSGN